MITDARRAELTKLADSALDDAEAVWSRVGSTLLAASVSVLDEASKSIPSQIPGYPSLEPGQAVVDHFIALVADMRDSTKHLMEAISVHTARVSQLQRVYYETSALLPTLAWVISYSGGHVTEYLGDGLLALFRLPTGAPDATIYEAYHAAEDCIGAVSEIINPALAKRYGLPALRIGVGMAVSKAIVTPVGLPGSQQPKAIGECVFRAAKLSSGGGGEIYIDERLYREWPTSPTGRLRFEARMFTDLKGYKISRSG